MTFNLYLKSSRTKLGLTQIVLAKQLKIPHATYQSWELGRRMPQSRLQTMIKAQIETFMENNNAPK